jgi:hypothetical protein
VLRGGRQPTKPQAKTEGLAKRLSTGRESLLYISEMKKQQNFEEILNS